MKRRLLWLVIGVVYTVSPLDGDWFPVLGWVDDVVVDLICAAMMARGRK